MKLREGEGMGYSFFPEISSIFQELDCYPPNRGSSHLPCKGRKEIKLVYRMEYLITGISTSNFDYWGFIPIINHLTGQSILFFFFFFVCDFIYVSFRRAMSQAYPYF